MPLYYTAIKSKKISSLGVGVTEIQTHNEVNAWR